MGKKPRTNPNGSNQYVLDPRQELTWKLYIDPKSETFANGLQSALKAGYEMGTALSITQTKWFMEKTQRDEARKARMVEKAERNLEEFLDMNTAGVRLGEKGEGVWYQDSGLVRAKLDATKFVAGKLGNDWKDKEENKTPIGVQVNIISYGQSDQLHRSLQLDTGEASPSRTSESGEIQDACLASESTEDDVSSEPTFSLGSG